MAPPNVKRQIRRFWYGAVLHKTPVHFIHISKTGGTARHVALRDHLITKKYFLEFHHHRIGLKNIPAGEKIILFFRDPVTKFVSAFNTRLRQGRPRNNVPWTAREMLIFEKFHTPNELAMALGSDDLTTRSDAKIAMKHIVHVNSFQADWIEDVDYLNSRLDDILFIGRQESLSADFEKLKKQLGLPSQLLLPKADIDTHRTPEDLDQTLSEEAANNIRKWYHKDDEMLRAILEIKR